MAIVDIVPADNAWHSSIHPRYVEWWYVDALLAPGCHLAGSLALWGNLQRPGSCVVRSDFSLAMPDGSVIDLGERVQLPAFHASTERCEVHLGNSHFRDAGRCYELHLHREDGTSLHLTLTPECPGFGYEHRFGADGSGCFWWIVPAPRVRAQGILQHGHGRIALEGIGYHDHNWASVSLSQELSGWKWGRLHGDDATLVFAAVEGKRETLFRGMALIERDRRGFGYRYLRVGLPGPDITMEERPGGWSLAMVDTDIRVQMHIEEGRLVLQRAGGADYRRFLSHANGTIELANRACDISGMMVHEFKQLGQADTNHERSLAQPTTQ